MVNVGIYFGVCIISFIMGMGSILWHMKGKFGNWNMMWIVMRSEVQEMQIHGVTKGDKKLGKGDKKDDNKK